MSLRLHLAPPIRTASHVGNSIQYPSNQSNSSKRPFLHVIIDTPIKSAARLPTGCPRLHHTATPKSAKLTKQKTPGQNLCCKTLPFSALPEWGQLEYTKSLPVSVRHSEQVLVVVSCSFRPRTKAFQVASDRTPRCPDWTSRLPGEPCTEDRYLVCHCKDAEIIKREQPGCRVKCNWAVSFSSYPSHLLA